jgi:hypothetical protein
LLVASELAVSRIDKFLDRWLAPTDESLRPLISFVAFAGIALYAASSKELSLPHLAVPVPPWWLFVVASVVLDVGLAVWREYRRDTLLKTEMLQLSEGLHEFQVECEGRLRQSRTTEQMMDTARKEFHERFGARINRLKSSWSLISPAYGPHWSGMLLGEFAQGAPTENLAKVAHSTIKKMAEQLPTPKFWKDRTRFRISLVLYLIVSLAVGAPLYWK